MEKEPFKNRTLGGRLVCRFRDCLRYVGIYVLYMHDSYMCVPLREIERGILSISEPPALVPYAAPPFVSFERSTSNCSRGTRRPCARYVCDL